MGENREVLNVVVNDRVGPIVMGLGTDRLWCGSQRERVALLIKWN